MKARDAYVPFLLSKPLNKNEISDLFWHKHFYKISTANNKKTLFKVSEHKIDAFLLSPVFSTKSHPNNTQLGVNKLIQWVHQSKIPIYALGGINLKNIQSLKKSGIIGFAFQRGY